MATASTNKELTDEDNELFNCSICLEHFRKPKQLPCLHTFCESCLDAYIQTPQNRKDSASSFKCPICRQEVRCSDPAAPINEWAALLPVNNVIMNVMDKTGASNDDSERKCAPCERGGETTTAAYWCFECSDNLCEMCKDLHRRMKTLTSHKIAPFKDVNAAEMPSRIPEVEEPCPDHNKEILKVYCLEHEQMCCVLCLAIHHRECKNIKTIEEISEKISCQTDVEEFCRSIQEVVEEVDMLQKKKQENMDRLCEKQEKLLEEMSDLVQDAIKNIYKLHDEFKSNLALTHKLQFTTLSEQKDKVENFIKTLKNGQTVMQTVAKHGTTKQFFITTEKVKTQLKYQFEQLQNDFKHDKDIDYDMQPDDNFTNLKSVGTVTVSNLSTLDISPITAAVSSFCSLTNEKFADPPVQIDMIELVKLWDVQDTYAWFSGGAFFNDGKAIFADARNKNLKIYDKEGKLSITHDLEHKIWDVAVHENNIVFVSNFDDGSICVYQILGNKLHPFHTIEIQTRGKVRGFDICDDYVFALCDKTIIVCDSEGNTVKSIPLPAYGFYSHAVSKKKFYFSEGDNIHLACLDSVEEINETYSFPEIKGARGITVDKSGNIYVCGMTSRALHLISADGRETRILKSNFDGIKQPYAVGLDFNCERLFVAALKMDENYGDACVEVFQIHHKQ